MSSTRMNAERVASALLEKVPVPEVRVTTSLYVCAPAVGMTVTGADRSTGHRLGRRLELRSLHPHPPVRRS
jgi:hypothetical protein